MEFEGYQVSFFQILSHLMIYVRSCQTKCVAQMEMDYVPTVSLDSILCMAEKKWREAANFEQKRVMFLVGLIKGSTYQQDVWYDVTTKPNLPFTMKRET